jgi:hypothetical protein
VKGTGLKPIQNRFRKCAVLEAAGKIGLKEKCVPQRLKPDVFARVYGRAEEAAEKVIFVVVLAVAGAKAHFIFKRLRHD